MRILQELVGTELRRARGRTMVESFDPATEELIAHAPEADSAVVAECLAAAREAFDLGPWPRMPVGERAQALEAVADAIEERSDELALAETCDTGMTISMTTQGHIPRAVSHFRFFAREAVRTGGDSFFDDAG